MGNGSNRDNDLISTEICQIQINQYCRSLNTIRREHEKDIQRQQSNSAKKSGHNRKGKRSSLKSPKSKTPRVSGSSYDDERAEGQEEDVVFGTKNGKKKRESA